MIYIDIEDMTFYDDANVLVKSFYPRTEVAVLRADLVVTEDDMIIKPLEEELPDGTEDLFDDEDDEL